jgi:histidyl-tRNA synthetase
MRASLAFGDRSLKSQLKSADRLKAAYTVILGEEELKAGQAAIREMESSQQVEVGLDGVVQWLQDKLNVGAGLRMVAGRAGA